MSLFSFLFTTTKTVSFKLFFRFSVAIYEQNRQFQFLDQGLDFPHFGVDMSTLSENGFSNLSLLNVKGLGRGAFHFFKIEYSTSSII